MTRENIATMGGTEAMIRERKRMNMGKKLLPLLLTTIFALVLACSSGDDPPLETAGGGGDAASGEPRIVAVPATGKCGDSFEIQGTGFLPGQQVQLGFFADIFDVSSLATATSDAAGAFKATVQNSSLFYTNQKCIPGLERVLAVKEADGRTPIRTRYELEQLGSFTLDPKVAKCADTLTIRGSAFPAGANVWFMLGDSDPMAHNFVKLGESTADAAGNVVFVYTPVAGMPCSQGEAAVRAWLNGPRADAMWNAEFEYAP